MTQSITPELTCEMREDCIEPVTHLEDKGYIYCAEHAQYRREYGHRCRKLRPHELRKLQRGEQLSRY